MDARLTILNGPSSGQVVPICPGKLLIGREEDCHLRLSSEFVSRHHCVLLCDEYTLRIRDLGSKNGTFVNSRRIGTTEMIVLDGDVVSIGETICQINLILHAANAPATTAGAQPVPTATALVRTGVFAGDTIQAERPDVVSPPSVPPTSTVVAPSVESARPRS